MAWPWYGRRGAMGRDGALNRRQRKRGGLPASEVVNRTRKTQRGRRRLLNYKLMHTHHASCFRLAPWRLLHGWIESGHQLSSAVRLHAAQLFNPIRPPKPESPAHGNGATAELLERHSTQGSLETPPRQHRGVALGRPPPPPRHLIGTRSAAAPGRNFKEFLRRSPAIFAARQVFIVFCYLGKGKK